MKQRPSYAITYTTLAATSIFLSSYFAHSWLVIIQNTIPNNNQTKLLIHDPNPEGLLMTLDSSVDGSAFDSADDPLAIVVVASDVRAESAFCRSLTSRKAACVRKWTRASTRNPLYSDRDFSNHSFPSSSLSISTYTMPSSRAACGGIYVSVWILSWL